MLRFLSRFLGVWVLAAALVAAVVDGAKSIAASALVTTPVSEMWGMLSGADPAAAAAPPMMAPWPLDLALTWIFAAPTAAVLLVVAVLLLVAGQRRHPPQLGREYAT